MDKQPNNNDNWEQPELPFDAELGIPLESENLVTYGKRQQEQINSAAPEWQYEQIDHAISQVKEHFGESYGHLMFVTATYAFSYYPSDDGKSHHFLEFKDASICGTLARVQSIELEKPYIILEIEASNIFYTDSDNTPRPFETTAPILIPFAFVKSHELL